MGQAMGTYVNRRILDPEYTPNQDEFTRIDPQYGFLEGRKPRVMVATVEEMDAAQIAPRNRDYCAHYLIRFKACKKRNFPFVTRCSHEKHDWDYCLYEDFVLRMKEFEREKRLLQRQKRKGLPGVSGQPEAA
ncbi:unnamed protein product [Notodromas monacha]|uniref:NADH dehydrogenase [ubiquinone] 1 beta subcomplex subunit 7 n=1 Tax=Notodromas monacha TaxID=399045 RepID=A0A7R9GG46_9CRUS|nr:unnamed protein product [Notodromas monacha]CAG0919807.1 unnamed protein product [Notodromas monacha]